MKLEVIIAPDSKLNKFRKSEAGGRESLDERDASWDALIKVSAIYSIELGLLTPNNRGCDLLAKGLLFESGWRDENVYYRWRTVE